MTAGIVKGKVKPYSVSLWIAVMVIVFMPYICLNENASSRDMKSLKLGSTTYKDPGSVLINEVYPEPSLDLNDDGFVNTLDEFVEIYNPKPDPVDISNWTITDN